MGQWIIHIKQLIYLNLWKNWKCLKYERRKRGKNKPLILNTTEIINCDFNYQKSFHYFFSSEGKIILGKWNFCSFLLFWARPPTLFFL